MNYMKRNGIIAFIVFFGITFFVSLVTMYIVDVFVFDETFALGRAIVISVPPAAVMGVVVASVYAKKYKEKEEGTKR